MFQYRHALLRMRQGDLDRDIARSRLMGRPKVATCRLLAAVQGWLSAEAPLPDDAAVAALLSAPPAQAARYRRSNRIVPKSNGGQHRTSAT